jgi:iron complex transport system substrate-binding protein
MEKRFFKLIILMGLVLIIVTGCHLQVSHHRNYFQEGKVISECRKVKHVLGESCIPLKPQRIIVVDQESLEIVVALGFQPVGTAQANIAGGKARVLGKIIGKIVDLGKDAQPNLEKMVKLHPDLILGLGISSENYELYSQIAPTLTFDYTHAAWKDTLYIIAQALDKMEQAKQLLLAYKDKIKILQTQLNNQQRNIAISVARFYAGWDFTQFQTPLSFSGSILNEVGFSVPQQQIKFGADKYSDGTSGTLNQETVEVLDADILFLALDPGSEKKLQRYQNNSLWQKLQVVKKKRVYTVDSGYWIFGNILSANGIVDDVSKYLLEANIDPS